MLYDNVAIKPPNNTEFEISLFGTGYGESVLCHFGENEWLVIDSCLNPESNEPLALEYLDKLNSSAKVVLIIATHFHDDHIRGLSKVVERFPNACFVISNALVGDEFIQLIGAAEGFMDTFSYGCMEFRRILDLLNTNIKTASEGKIIFKNKYCEIISLSPSDYAEAMARLEIKEYLPRVNEQKMGIVPRKTNHFAVVVKCTFNNQVAWLLGADLENNVDDKWGWKAILKSTVIPKEKSHVFKIPHHGSDNGHSDEVWSSMLVENPITILTPFINGKTIIPTKRSLEKINLLTNRSYITGKPERKKAKHEDSTVKRILRETGTELYTLNSQLGHIQLRMDHSKLAAMKEWHIKTFGSAMSTSSI